MALLRDITEHTKKTTSVLIEKAPQMAKWRVKQWRGEGQTPHRQAAGALSSHMTHIVSVTDICSTDSPAFLGNMISNM